MSYTDLITKLIEADQIESPYYFWHEYSNNAIRIRLHVRSNDLGFTSLNLIDTSCMSTEQQEREVNHAICELNHYLKHGEPSHQYKTELARRMLQKQLESGSLGRVMEINAFMGVELHEPTQDVG